MMPRDMSDDPDGATDGSEAISAHQGPVTPPYVHLYRQIAPLATIGLAHRARLTAQVAELLQPIWPHQLSMAVGVVYTVAAATSDAHGKRVRSFLRWSAAYDAAGGDVKLAERRARRSLREVIASTQERLAAHYSLASVERADVIGALGADPCELPLIELRYASWQPTTQWLSPAHVQPVLDCLLDQPGSAALSIRVERIADEQPGGDPRLRLSIMAMGEATNDAALSALADEFRGCGVLAPRHIKPRQAPVVERVLAETAAERAYIAHNRVQPWVSSDQRLLDVALTSHEAGLLLPLPMPLYEQ